MAIAFFDGFDDFSGNEAPATAPLPLGPARLGDLSAPPTILSWPVHKPSGVGYEVKVNGKVIPWTRRGDPADPAGTFEITCEQGLRFVMRPSGGGEYGVANISALGRYRLFFDGKERPS